MLFAHPASGSDAARGESHADGPRRNGPAGRRLVQSAERKDSDQGAGEQLCGDCYEPSPGKGSASVESRASESRFMGVGDAITFGQVAHEDSCSPRGLHSISHTSGPRINYCAFSRTPDRATISLSGCPQPIGVTYSEG
jgi:hypothetical protein